MNIREFTIEVSALTPAIHTAMIRRLPKMVMGGKINFPQMALAELLSSRNECCMSDISRLLGVTKSAVTGMVDRLIASGVLKRVRSGDDRRVVKVSLTRKGKKIAAEIRKFRFKIVESFFRDISASERAQYVRILRKIHGNLKASGEFNANG